jgi:xanthosine utilization system XapX-like protein
MKVLSWLLLTGVFIGLIYGLLNLPIYSPKAIQIIDQYSYIFTILGALGFTFLGNKIGIIRRKTHEITMKLFGYPKGIIKNNKENK